MSESDTPDLPRDEIVLAPERDLAAPRTDMSVPEMREWLRNWVANSTGQPPGPSRIVSSPAATSQKNAPLWFTVAHQPRGTQQASISLSAVSLSQTSPTASVLG